MSTSGGPQNPCKNFITRRVCIGDEIIAKRLYRETFNMGIVKNNPPKKKLAFGICILVVYLVGGFNPSEKY